MCILNCTGIILHFADPILDCFYILDPQWISVVFQRVMEKAKQESVNGKIIGNFIGRAKIVVKTLKEGLQYILVLLNQADRTL